MPTQETVSLSDLYNTVRDYESLLAEGSETAMLGDFWAAMHRLADIPRDPGLYEDVQVPKAEADWWLAAYAALAANPSVDDLQSLYDSI